MKNQKLHDEVKILARVYLESEKNMVGPLIIVQRLKAYRDFKHKGLFNYCRKELNFSESTAHMFRTVVNHAIRIPELRKALESDRLTVTYASKIVSQLTPENVAEVLAYTDNHSIAETERWLAKEHGGPEYRNFKMTVENFQALRELKDIVPGNLNDNEVLHKILIYYRSQKHPVEKAKRAAFKKAKKAKVTFASAAPASNPKSEPKQTATNSKSASKKSPNRRKRKPLTAEARHAVNLRDNRRCIYHDNNGERCKETRWLAQHHIQLVSEGGGNDPENLITLCPEHHDLVHQLSFPMNDQHNWQTNVLQDEMSWHNIALNEQREGATRPH